MAFPYPLTPLPLSTHMSKLVTCETLASYQLHEFCQLKWTSFVSLRDVLCARGGKF